MNILQEDASCMICSSEEGSLVRSSELDASQKEAISTVVKLSQCNHQKTIKLIWGPPGTGKTKTVATFLAALVKLKVRTVTCAPTNTAVLQVASRLRKVLKENLEHEIYGLGDVVLFGNGNRMKADDHEDIVDMFLDRRAELLSDCFSPLTGWNHTLVSLITFLEDPQKLYNSYLEMLKRENDDDDEESGNRYEMTYFQFAKMKLDPLLPKMAFWIRTLCTHLPTHILPLHVANTMMRALASVNNFTTHDIWNSSSRKKVTDVLELLPRSFSVSSFRDLQMIKEFCLGNAKMIMCTASATARLQTEGSKAVQMVVIDEAAQLKECESVIPLQLPGVQHAVLVGDERQLQNWGRTDTS